MRPEAGKRYLLVMLLLLLAANNMEFPAFGLVLQDIKEDLALSDTQLGFLTGLAFALFYSLAGIPLARWADRGNRVVILSLTAAIRSVLVALCGLAGTFTQLLSIRVGIGVGEAGCQPASHSLIADSFDRDERPRAVSIFMQGNTLSLVIGYFVAGWLNELYGWRVMFVVLGLPGLALAMLAWISLREPRHALTHDRSATIAPHPAVPVREVASTLWGSVPFRHLLLAFSVVYFFGTGIVQWQPAFFARSYGLGSGELGTWLMMIYGIAGMLGMYLGGEWAARYAARDEARQLRFMAVAYCLYGALSMCAYIVRDAYQAFALIGLATLVGTMTTGPLFATIQTLTPQRMRATAVSIIYLFANLIGLGLGPVATGVLSDALRPLFAEESLRYTLVALSPGYIWVAWHLWHASRTVDRYICR